jgi:hypothetical protein
LFDHFEKGKEIGNLAGSIGFMLVLAAQIVRTV